MDPKDVDWGRVDQLYDRLLALPPKERENVLAALAPPVEHPEVLRLVRIRLAEPPDQDDWPRTGDRVGSYVVGERLGAGGMGVVYSARHAETGQQVALKLILPRDQGLPEVTARFKREIQTLAALHHGNIAKVYHSDRVSRPGTGKEVPYFTMELVAGVPLTTYAKHRKLSVGKRLKLLVRVCEAVEFAHKQRIIHRDLKPTNILVDDSGKPMVIDFGLAQIFDSSQPRGAGSVPSGGTFAYMSPEQVDSRCGTVGPTSDVYALGVILYELIADKLPYDVQGKEPEKVREVILQSRPARLRTWRRGGATLNWIVSTALAKVPEQRYQSVHDLRVALEDYLTPRPWSRWLLALLLLVILGLGLAGWKWFFDPTIAVQQEQGAEYALRLLETYTCFVREKDSLAADAGPLTDQKKEKLKDWLKRLDFGRLKSPLKEDFTDCRDAVLKHAALSPKEGFQRGFSTGQTAFSFYPLLVDFEITGARATDLGQPQLANLVDVLLRHGARSQLFLGMCGGRGEGLRPEAQLFTDYLVIGVALSGKARPVHAQAALLSMNPGAGGPDGVKARFEKLHQALLQLSRARTAQDAKQQTMHESNVLLIEIDLLRDLKISDQEIRQGCGEKAVQAVSHLRKLDRGLRGK